MVIAVATLSEIAIEILLYFVQYNYVHADLYY